MENVAFRDKYGLAIDKLSMAIQNAKDVLKKYEKLNREGLDCDKVLLQKIKEIISAS